MVYPICMALVYFSNLKQKKINQAFFFLSMLAMLAASNQVFASSASSIDSLQQLLLKSQADSERFKIHNKLFDAFMANDMRAPAFNQLNKMFELANRSGNKGNQANAYYNLGVYNNNIDNYVVALTYLMEALRRYRDIQDTKGEAASLMNIGIAYYTLKEYSEALNYYHQAELLYLKNNDQQKVDIVKYLNANIFLQMGLPNAALKIFKEIVTPGVNISEQRKYECYLGIGSAFLKIGINDSADIYIVKAYQFFDATGNKDAKCYAGAKLSELLLSRNDPQNAIDTGLVNLDVARQINSRDKQLQLYSVLSQAYYKQGIFDKAFDYQKKYYEFKDDLFNEKSGRQLNELRKQYIEEQHKHELEREDQRKQRENIITNSLFGLLFIIIGMLIYRYILKQRVNKKLKASNKQLENTNLELHHTLEVLSETQEKLVQQEKISSLGKVTAGIAHEIQNPLNFVTNFATLNNDLIAELSHADSEIERQEAMSLLHQNNEKIRHHGLRANSIVIEMLMESREEVIPKQMTDINKLIRDNYELAYQAFRAKHEGFTCGTKLYVQSLPLILTEQRKLGRVFLNLFENALYALRKRSLLEPGFLPRVVIRTSNNDGMIRAVIEDNGTGISKEILKDIFNPFFTTKPTGDGTGLGLSICFDIIAKRHKGLINVESEINQFTRFIVELPSNIKEEAK